MPSSYQFEYHLRPGRTFADDTLARLVAELRAVGKTCLEPLPEYQVFLGTRDELSDKVITIARRRDGTMAGFCAAVLLDVPDVGEVLHLGLTCVHPDDRRARLTHLLVSRLVTRYLLVNRYGRRIWVTNVACVLSSLGNFARNFRDVHPAPAADGSTPPEPRRPEPRLIAEAFDRRYRAKAHIQPWAVFDESTYVFRGSGRGTAFQKRADDARYHHRDESLNRYYAGLLHFDDGDELLQVGSLGVADVIKYALGR